MTITANIAREVPQLISSLIDKGIMKAVIEIFEKSIPTDGETIPTILYFLN